MLWTRHGVGSDSEDDHDSLASSDEEDEESELDEEEIKERNLEKFNKFVTSWNLNILFNNFWNSYRI